MSLRWRTWSYAYRLVANNTIHSLRSSPHPINREHWEYNREESCEELCVLSSFSHKCHLLAGAYRFFFFFGSTLNINFSS
jgi:hypothetical protein